MLIAPWVYVPTMLILALLLGTVVLFARAAREAYGSADAPRWMAPTVALLTWAGALVVLVMGLEPRWLQVFSVSMWGLVSVEALLLWHYTTPPPPTAPPPPMPTISEMGAQLPKINGQFRAETPTVSDDAHVQIIRSRYRAPR